ncbi:DUF6207 family protein [Streptomyces bacillaris]|uniref:DUF6207 family protein n=1 Tax=Streptomyces bacillaris TaxID=68179 RepID=UPI003F4D3158
MFDITAADEETALQVMAGLERQWATSGTATLRRTPGIPGVQARGCRHPALRDRVVRGRTGRRHPAVSHPFGWGAGGCFRRVTGHPRRRPSPAGAGLPRPNPGCLAYPLSRITGTIPGSSPRS